MTDRHAGYVVTLDQSIREDDARETILVALRQIRGVISVEPVVESIELLMAQELAISKIKYRLLNVLNQ